MGQSELSVGLPEKAELYVIQGDRFEQGTDNLTAVEEGLANLQFFSDHESGNAAVNWFEYEESTEVTGWLDDQPDIVEFQPEQGQAGARVPVMAGRAESQSALPESTGTKNFALDGSIVNAGKVEQQTALTQVEQQGFERTGKAKIHEEIGSAVGTRTEDAVSMQAESAVSTNMPEPDRCLLNANGMWWEDDALCLAPHRRRLGKHSTSRHLVPR